MSEWWNQNDKQLSNELHATEAELACIHFKPLFADTYKWKRGFKHLGSLNFTFTPSFWHHLGTKEVTAKVISNDHSIV